MKQVIQWHVFADGIDEWFNTLKEAKQYYKELRESGCENRRIYKEIYENDEMVHEDYHTGAGDFPY